MLGQRPQASVTLDLLTWLVLVPMENAAADPASRAFWHALHHSFESYNVGALRTALCCSLAVCFLGSAAPLPQPC